MKSPKTVALCLALALVGLILLLNLGSPDEVAVSVEEYRRLLEGRRIESAVVVGTVFHGRLRAPVRFRVGDRPWPAERIVVDLGYVGSEARAAWAKYGVRVTFQEAEEPSRSPWADLLSWTVLGGLLALGVYHIVSRARHSRQIVGGPEMRELERMRAQGLLTEEEYQAEKERLLGEV